MISFEEIYNIVAGYQDPGPETQWVQTVLKEGTRYQLAHERLWETRLRLCERLGTDLEDRDISDILSAVVEMEAEMGRAMFLCGMEYARRSNIQ